MIIDKEGSEILGKTLRQTFAAYADQSMMPTQGLMLAVVALLPYCDSESFLKAAGARLVTDEQGNQRLGIDAVDHPFFQEQE